MLSIGAARSTGDSTAAARGFTVAAAEVLHSKFRRWLDVVVFTYLLAFQRVPATYWVLRNSVCWELSNGRGPFLTSLASDEWLATFPCESYTHESGFTRVNTTVFNSISNFLDEPLEARAWFLSNVWWVYPYIATWHSFVENGGAFIFGSCVLIAPHFALRWWNYGGRSLTVSGYRSYGHMVMFYQLVFKGAESVVHWAVENPHVYATKVLFTCGVLGALPWRLQKVQVVLEMASLCIVALSRVHFRPPSRTWLLQLTGGISLAGAMVLAVSAVESSVIPYAMHCSWEPSAPSGPVHALKQAVKGLMEVPRLLLNALLSTWTAAFLVFCLYNVMFLLLPPASVLMLF